MYICENCGETFEEPARIQEIHEELAERPSEYFEVCPFCESDFIEEAVECSVCGSFIPESQAKFNLCEKCENAALEKGTDMVTAFKKKLHTEFTDNEIEYLSWFAEDDEELQLWLR